MPNRKTDTDGNLIPTREFLILSKMVLKKSEEETGASFIEWLEDISEKNNVPIDDDVAMYKAVHAVLKKEYLDHDEKLPEFVIEENEDEENCF